MCQANSFFLAVKSKIIVDNSWQSLVVW
jgi:hypothetical protein